MAQLKDTIIDGTLSVTEGLAVNGDVQINEYNIDYVIEQGTSGVWTYRKWNSGIAECWTDTVSGTGTDVTLVGSYYWSYLSISLPFTFLTHTGYGNGRLGTGLGFAYIATNSNSVTVHVLGNQSQSTITYNCRVIGTWK